MRLMTEVTLGVSTDGPPGGHQPCDETTAPPTYYPGRLAMAGRKKVWEPRGHIQSTMVISGWPPRSRKETAALALMVELRFCT